MFDVTVTLLNQPKLFPMRDHFFPAVHVQLAMNVLDIGAGCADCDHQFISDLRAGESLSQQMQDLRFLTSEALSSGQ